MTAGVTDAELAWRLLVNHGLADTELPGMLDIWPSVTVSKRSPDPKPAKVRRHPGERICDRCNHWSAADSYPHDGGVCETCIKALTTRPTKRRRSSCRG